jgi:uncharacterized membrane protein YkvA (DUF1232 family)
MFMHSEFSLKKKLLHTANIFRRELAAYRMVLRDNRTPLCAKCILACAVGYAMLPFDLIPDFIPVIGHLDDIIIIPALIMLAVKMIPSHIMEECRQKAIIETGNRQD